MTCGKYNLRGMAQTHKLTEERVLFLRQFYEKTAFSILLILVEYCTQLVDSRSRIRKYKPAKERV